MLYLTFVLLAFFPHVLLAGGKCKDVLSHCDIVKSNCNIPRAEKQMRRLCAKTCGFCYEQKSKVPLEAVFTAKIFLLYIKNDIKFLKGEILDIQARLRHILIRRGTEKTSVKPDKAGKKIGDSEIANLRSNTKRLSVRLQEQTSRLTELSSRFRLDLSGLRNNITGEMKMLVDDLQTLNDDFKEEKSSKVATSSNITNALEKIEEDIAGIRNKSKNDTRLCYEAVSTLDSTISRNFSHFQNNVFSQQLRSRENISRIAERMDNLTNIIQTMKNYSEQPCAKNCSQSPTYEDLKVKINELSRKLDNVSDMLQVERNKSSTMESKFQELSNKEDAKLNQMIMTVLQRQAEKYAELETKYQEVSNRQNNSLITRNNNTARIDELFTKLENVSNLLQAERRNSSNLEYKLQELSDKVRNESVNDTDDRITELSNKLENVTNKLTQLTRRYKSIQQVIQQLPNRTQPIASKQNNTLMNKISLNLQNLSQAARQQKSNTLQLQTNLHNYFNRCMVDINAIKRGIQDMSARRNNGSVTLSEMRNNFQKGILSLLGPQGNFTRFFSPRFNWENGRLYIFGYIAIYHDGIWGTICDDNFDNREAEVLCRMAGYQGGYYDDGIYNIGTGRIDGVRRVDLDIWIDELLCDGTEKSIGECRTEQSAWGEHDCEHREDVGIKCIVT